MLYMFEYSLNRFLHIEELSVRCCRASSSCCRPILKVRSSIFTIIFTFSKPEFKNLVAASTFQKKGTASFGSLLTIAYHSKSQRMRTGV